MLMLVASIQHNVEPTQVFAIRFYESGTGHHHVKKLARRQIKKRYPKLDLTLLSWDIYEPTTTRGGWPKFVGDAAWYE